MINFLGRLLSNVAITYQRFLNFDQFSANDGNLKINVNLQYQPQTNVSSITENDFCFWTWSTQRQNKWHLFISMQFALVNKGIFKWRHLAVHNETTRLSYSLVACVQYQRFHSFTWRSHRRKRFWLQVSIFFELFVRNLDFAGLLPEQKWAFHLIIKFIKLIRKNNFNWFSHKLLSDLMF